MNPACTYRKILGQESGSGEKNRVVLNSASCDSLGFVSNFYFAVAFIFRSVYVSVLKSASCSSGNYSFCAF